jgi:hypothetical protein
VGLGPRARDWAIGFGGGEEPHYRRQWCASSRVGSPAPHTEPTHQVHDMWAWAPMPEVGRLVAAKTRGRPTAGW